MNKHVLAFAATLVICALAVLGLIGCAGNQQTEPGSSGSIVTLDAEGVVSVPLDYSAGTGFEWQCTLPEDDHTLTITSEGDEDLAADEQIDGGPLRHWVTLRAANPGTTTLTCELARPWEDGKPAEIQTYNFTVDSDLQITFNADDSDFVLDPVWGANS